MVKKVKRYDSKLKAKVAIEALKEEKSALELWVLSHLLKSRYISVMFERNSGVYDGQN